MDPAIDYLQTKRDLILAGPQGNAYIDIQRDNARLPSLQEYGGQLMLELQTPPPTADADDDEPMIEKREGKFLVRSELELSNAPQGYEGMEWVADLKRGSQPWRWIVRAYRKKPTGEEKPGPIYVIRAYVPLRRFEALGPEMRKALDSVRFPP